LSHAHYGDRYVKFISKFYFMLLCPGRLGFEYLKYTECAYSGCIPVGKKPKTFFELNQELFFEINENDIQSSVSELFKISHSTLEYTANGYRNWMRENRNPCVLNSILLSRLNEYER
jgi:hypothetical protein